MFRHHISVTTAAGKPCPGVVIFDVDGMYIIYLFRSLLMIVRNNVRVLMYVPAVHNYLHSPLSTVRLHGI